MLIEQGHPLYAAFGGLHHLYANDKALEGYRSGNEELERLLAMAPVYNFSHYEVLPLAEMEDPMLVLRPPGGE